MSLMGSILLAFPFPIPLKSISLNLSAQAQRASPSVIVRYRRTEHREWRGHDRRKKGVTLGRASTNLQRQSLCYLRARMRTMLHQKHRQQLLSVSFSNPEVR